MSGGLFRWVENDLDLRLALMPRPPGGQRLDAAMGVLRRHGVDVLVSFQTPVEAEACGLEREAESADLFGIRFMRFPIDDHGVPSSPEAALRVAQDILQELHQGRGVLVHCFAGIGRSGLMAILVMTLAGFSLGEAAERVSAARQFPVPETQTQWFWLEAHAPRQSRD
ncbi:MAG: dual specificity protein phosphatase family protein [Myxococcota bacterium]